MKNLLSKSKIGLLLLLFSIGISCNVIGRTQAQPKEEIKTNHPQTKNDNAQIAEYVTSIFEDSKGNLWFGTLDKGMARYDGETLKYFTTQDGLPSDRVTSVMEDANGIYWFSTGNGLSKYDGQHFTNFKIGEDPNSNVVSKLLIDSKNVFWVGTWNGVFKFDGVAFQPFSVPYPEVDTKINEDTKYWVTLSEDAKGNIWLRRPCYGICKYDGISFTHLLKKDGLHSNYVTDIAFEKDGSVWIGTKVAERDDPDPEKRFGKGGVNKMIGKEIITFPEIKGFNDGDVYEIYRDKSDNIWISTVKNGVYRYDGLAFKNFYVPISIMGMAEDRKGNLWLGGAGGLYRINQHGEVINVTTNGPWK
jgi:ligand-binding sensor domain-containing protein